MPIYLRNLANVVNHIGMLRDDEPTILASIESARRDLDRAEHAKKAADEQAAATRETRDAARRLLNDRIITAAVNQVPQGLIAKSADRSREAIRVLMLGRTLPQEVVADIPESSSGSYRDWQSAALIGWLRAAHDAGLEPKELDGAVEGEQAARVLVYDTEFILLRNGEQVRAVLATTEN